MIPTAPLLRGCYVDSFAYGTIKDRLPTILTKVIDGLARHDFDALSDTQKSQLISGIAAIKYEMTRDKQLCLTVGDPIWDQALLSLGKDEQSWFKAPWLFVECLMYKLLQNLVHQVVETDVDLFIPMKMDSISSTIESMDRISKDMKLWREKPIEDAILSKLVEISLWGNQADLSLNIDGPTNHQSVDDHLIIDNRKEFFERLKSSKNITIVLDNAGFELYSDFCLAEYLTRHGHIVTFECKKYPWFVSDTIVGDVDILLDTMAKHSETLGDQVGLIVHP
jgi:hypothetical protein